MAVLFLDTSALVKLYVREPGTEAMLLLADPDAGNRLAILSITRVELRSAVRRRQREDDFDQAAADALLDQFNSDLADVFTVQPVNDLVIGEAAGAADRHGLRAYDALQLGGFLALRAQFASDVECQLVCADIELADAARRDAVALVNLVDPTGPQ